MFQKLTPRERVLAYGVIGLVPATLVFIGIFWFIGKFGDNNDRIMGLATQIEAEEDAQTEAMNANRRRIYFNSVSFPPDIEVASIDYGQWLKRLLQDLQLDFDKIKPLDAGDLKLGQKLIGQRKTFSVPMTGDLQQLTQFLERFYSLDALHRINSLKILPLTEAAGNDKRVRTGKLSVNVKIEVLSLTTGEPNRDFTKQYRELARTSEEYQQSIIRRNIFGPANNTPVVSARTNPSYTSGEEVRVSITGKDADEQDQLTFELIDPAIKDASLEFKPGDRSAKLIVPGQPEGRVEFKVRVTDNGFPPKESLADVSVNFKDREVKVAVKEEPKEPYVFAKETRITACVLEKSGEWQVWIKKRIPSGEKFKLSVGESFELDKQKWVVASIEPKSAVFQVGEKLLTIEKGIPFDQPSQEVKAPDSKVSNAPTGGDSTAADAEGPVSEESTTPNPSVATF